MPKDSEIYEIQVGYRIDGGNFHIMTVGVFDNVEDATELVEWIKENYPSFNIYFETERVNNMDLFKETVTQLESFIRENETNDSTDLFPTL